MSRGILIVPYSAVTERMAYALVESLRRNGCVLPVRILAQDYLTGLRWRCFADVQVKLARAVHGGKDHLRWLNKLHAMQAMPFEETLFFDCDMVATADVTGWFDLLGTDDVSFWNLQRSPESVPDAQVTNMLNPHRFCPNYGVPAVPTMLGGGHYFLRRGGRTEAILRRVAEIMIEANEDPACDYWKMAEAGNIIGDEPAASMACVEFGVNLPPPSPLIDPPVGVFMAPWQRWVRSDFRTSDLRFHCQWAGQESTPQAVHFAGGGKEDGVYRRWLDDVVQ